VIAEWVQRFAAEASCVAKGRGKNREAETAEKGKAVGIIIKTVVNVLMGHAVESQGHPW
jgi:hypothetical protein